MHRTLNCCKPAPPLTPAAQHPHAEGQSETTRCPFGTTTAARKQTKAKESFQQRARERRLHSPPAEQRRGGEGFLSEQEVTLPAALHIPLAGSGPVVSAGALPGAALQPSGTNVTSGVPKPPRRGRRGACVVPWAPGLRSDGGLVRHQAGHRGQGSLTLMVLLLRSFTGVPLVLGLDVVRCGNTLNGMEGETALEP